VASTWSAATAGRGEQIKATAQNKLVSDVFLFHIV